MPFDVLMNDELSRIQRKSGKVKSALVRVVDALIIEVLMFVLSVILIALLYVMKGQVLVERTSVVVK